MKHAHLTLAQQEDLSDARLVLDTASHNLRAAVATSPDSATLTTALDNAEAQITQVLATLRRVRSGLARR